METFKDCKGNVWIIDINTTVIARLKAAGFDLSNILADQGGDWLKRAGELLADVVKLRDVLYAICYSQAEERRVTIDDFGELLKGEVVVQAAESLISAIIDFFPDPRTRQVMYRVIERSKLAQEALLRKAMETAIREIDKLDPQALADQMAATSLSKSTN